MSTLSVYNTICHCQDVPDEDIPEALATTELDPMHIIAVFTGDIIRLRNTESNQTGLNGNYTIDTQKLWISEHLDHLLISHQGMPTWIYLQIFTFAN